MPQAAYLLRSARRSAGLTQAALAGRMEVGQSVIARMERPDSNPTFATLDAALAATGHHLELRPSPPSSVDMTQIAERLRLSPKERLETFTRSQANIIELVRRARRVDR